MKNQRIGGLVLSVAWLPIWLLAAAPGDPEAPSAAAAASAVEDVPVAPPAGGLEALIDPDSGELAVRLAEEMLDAAPPPRPADGWLNTYSDDLVQEPAPGGGYMVDLEGRFQTSVVATIDPETGEMTTDCVRGGAAGGGDDR